MTNAKARILLWGIAGAGKTATLEMIHSKLQPSLRGEIHREPTAIDPTIHFETLSIQLGPVGGINSQIDLIAVPGAPDQAMTRKQLLDEVEGIILVLDCSPGIIETNDETIAELRSFLGDYGRSLEDMPIVLQYNKRDIADPFEIEAFHRRTGFVQSAVFETIATTGHGILPTLTTISKHVIRARKNRSSGASETSSASIDTVIAQTMSIEADAAAQSSLSDPEASTSQILEAAILAEDAENEAGASLPFDDAAALDMAVPTAQPDWNAVSDEPSKPDTVLGSELRIVSVGAAQVDTEGELRLPLVLGDDSGQTRSVVLSMRLDTTLDHGND